MQSAPIGEPDLAWLRDTVVTPVLTELRLPPPSPEPPRLWCCPVGIAAFLPWHAAALDEVVSSYLTTAGAAEPRPASSGTGLLMVEMSRTPGPGRCRERPRRPGTWPGWSRT